MTLKPISTEIANAICDKLQQDINSITWLRYRASKAYVGALQKVEVNEECWSVKPLRSYDTIVGFILMNPETFGAYEVYEVGKYSKTTSCQLSKIFKEWYFQYPRYQLERIHGEE